jgi:hypothetical protein
VNEDDHEFDLGLPQDFDPGYYGGDAEGSIRQICVECGQPFDRQTGGEKPTDRRSCLDELCSGCFWKRLRQAAAEAEETAQIAAGLGMTLEEFICD